MSFRVVRASKFRHVFGKEFKKQDVRTPAPTPPKKNANTLNGRPGSGQCWLQRVSLSPKMVL